MHMILLLKFFDLCQNRLYFSFHRVTIVYMVKKGHYNKPGSFIRMSISAGLFPANTLIRSSGLHSLAFGFGTFAYAKDQASSSRDGLLKESPTPMLYEMYQK